MVRFRCIRSNGNARKRHETGNGNTGYPSCFRNGLTCFCHVSVYGFLQFRPVLLTRSWCEIELERTEFLQQSLISKSNLIAYQANKIWVLKSWSNSPFRLSIPPYEKLHSDFTVSRISSTIQGIVYRVGNRKPKKEMQKNENKRNPTQAHGLCIRWYAI